MDYLDPAKKRAHKIRLLVGYGLIAVLIASTSLILLFQSYGYDIDRRTGQVIQNGLIYFNSHPVASSVYVNGSNKGRTDLRQVIPAGSYDVELKQSGYRSWKHKVKLEGGSIEQLTYPFLFPSKLKTADWQLYDEVPRLATQSPDRRWLLVQPAGTITHFDQFDLNSGKTIVTPVELPTGLLSPAVGDEKLTLVEWSTDNRHVLLRHDFSGRYEFIIVDKDKPAESVNINRSFNVNPWAVRLRNKAYDRYYFYDAPAKTISAAELRTKQAQPILTKVISFKPYGTNVILYVSNDSKDASQIAVRIWDGRRSYLLHYYPADSKYQVDMAGYSGTDYAVVMSSAKGGAYLYKDPLGQARGKQTPASFLFLRSTNPEFISFSENTRFIAVQSANRFAVYDIDTNRRFYYQTAKNVPSGVKAKWMDGHRLVFVADGFASVFDFDGTNNQELSSAYDNFEVFFDTKYRALYNIAPSTQTPAKSSLTRSGLFVE